ncbi:MAG: hypothetical protein HC848_01230 [Limnobacter sp.]|nr:hypothetical protein [Limnobacter sp.]
MNKAVLVKKKWLTLIAAAAMGMTSQDALALKLEQALVVQLPDRTELHLRFDQDIPDSVLTFRTGEPQVQIIDFPLELANDKIDLTGQVAALPGGLRLQTKDRHTKIEFSVPENQEVQRIVSGKGMIFRIGGKPLVSGVKLASAKNAVLAKPIPEPKAEAKPEIILAKAGSAPVVAAATEKALTPAVDFSLQSLNVEENNDYTALVLQFNQGPNQNAIKSYSLMHAKQYVLDFPSLIDASQTLKLSGESRIENYNLFKTDTRSRMVLNLKDNYQVDPVFGETELRLMFEAPNRMKPIQKPCCKMPPHRRS